MIDAAERAERLGAALMVCGLVHEPAAAALRALEGVPLLTDDEWDAWRALEHDDLALAQACLDAEFELRQRQFDALERFGRAWSSGTGDSTETRLASLTADAAREALLSAHELGWLLPRPSDEDER